MKLFGLGLAALVALAMGGRRRVLVTVETPVERFRRLGAI
jgi:hypothetical protein